MQSPEQGQSTNPLWIRAAVSEEAFAHEQASLGKLWTFVGCLSDIPKDGDWFRTKVGGRSIFVQRFGETVRGFENRCAHRFFPLRTTDKGNGPILCGFHHWRYNQEGQAVGIPKCPEMFGKIPREMNARIASLDVDTCGDLIFARWPSEDERETLKEFLHDGYDMLEAICAPKRKPFRFLQKIRAHWKFSHHISLDDYHIVAVHPSTFGKTGYLDPANVQYRRFGRHSVYFHSPNTHSYEKMLRTCRDRTYTPHHYVIFNLFPNFLISQFRVPDIFGTDHWYITILRYVPVSSSSSEVQARIFEVPFPVKEKMLSRWFRPILNLVLPPIISVISRQIMNEDNEVCEGQQTQAPNVTGEQTLGAHETRIGWFEEAYRAALTGEKVAWANIGAVGAEAVEAPVQEVAAE